MSDVIHIKTRLAKAVSDVTEAHRRVHEIEEEERQHEHARRMAEAQSSAAAKAKADAERLASVQAMLADATRDERITILEQLEDIVVPGHPAMDLLRNVSFPQFIDLHQWLEEERAERDREQRTNRRAALLAEAFGRRDEYVQRVKPIRQMPTRMTSPDDVIVVGIAPTMGVGAVMVGVEETLAFARPLSFVPEKDWAHIREAHASQLSSKVAVLEGDDRFNIFAVAHALGCDFTRRDQELNLQNFGLVMRRVECRRWLATAAVDLAARTPVGNAAMYQRQLTELLQSCLRGADADTNAWPTGPEGSAA